MDELSTIAIIIAMDGNGPGLDQVRQDPNPDPFFGPGSRSDPKLQGP